MKAKNIEITIKIESLEDSESKFEIPEFKLPSSINDSKPEFQDGLFLRKDTRKKMITECDLVWYLAPSLSLDSEKPITPTNRKIILDRFLHDLYKDKKVNSKFWICDIDNDREQNQKEIYIYVDKQSLNDLTSAYCVWLENTIDDYLKKFPNL